MWIIPYPVIDPVILPLWGPLAIRWYGLSYAAAVLFGYIYIPFWSVRAPYCLPKKIVQDAISQTLLWSVIGGRLGYILFYEPWRLWHDPLSLWRLWEGGMSFHGGLMGVGLGLLLYTRRHKVSWLILADLLSLGIPFGLCCGRVANFINGELYGRIASVPWAIIFPQGGPWPRHPSQIYEALSEGMLLLVILGCTAQWTKVRNHPGALTGLFIGGYGIARFIIEFFREPSVDYSWLPWELTWGQVLSIPLLMGGITLIAHSGWCRCRSAR